jgi:ferredoxin, 2Fe-2S
MPRITFVAFDGTPHTVDAKMGDSLMQTAIKNAVPGIDADCGGACACATCHVYVEQTWVDRVGQVSELEASMLDFAQTVRANSRLSCQIKVVEALDGLIVSVPESQH